MALVGFVHGELLVAAGLQIKFVDGIDEDLRIPPVF